MKIRLFNKETDFKDLIQLLEKRRMHPGEAELVPVLGIVIEDNEDIIAMGFLRQCEGNVAIMDSVITDPRVDSLKRHQALDIIFKEIIDLAKSFNIREVIGFSLHDGMIERSKIFGFLENTHKVLVLNLEG